MSCSGGCGGGCGGGGGGGGGGTYGCYRVVTPFQGDKKNSAGFRSRDSARCVLVLILFLAATSCRTSCESIARAFGVGCSSSGKHYLGEV